MVVPPAAGPKSISALVGLEKIVVKVTTATVGIAELKDEVAMIVQEVVPLVPIEPPVAVEPPMPVAPPVAVAPPVPFEPTTPPIPFAPATPLTPPMAIEP